MEYLEKIVQHAQEAPDRIAVAVDDGRSISYEELQQASEAIASAISCLEAEHHLDAHVPIAVYGHKDPLMVAVFVGCLKSGHPYVPIDMHSVPLERAAGIIGQIGFTIVFDLSRDGVVLANSDALLPSTVEDESVMFVDYEQVKAIVADNANAESNRDCWVKGEDLAYILFTSGSTGTPKGVQVTSDCFDNFCRWALTLGADAAPRDGAVFLNQAPFSFDLSVYELAQSLFGGGTMYCLSKTSQDDARLMIDSLANSHATIWVSTPSFSELCLANPEFSQELMPECKVFLFCGEPLRNATAARLQERFPESVIVNSYGPTESTVAVTATVVTPQMSADAEPLHCGAPRKGTRIVISQMADDGTEIEAPTGELGEIVIVGDTVARGYFHRDDLTEKVFSEAELEGDLVRSYRTGDEGYLDEDGNLHCRGRIDLQVKLNGFRIELGEIEQVLAGLPEVKEAAVILATKDSGASHLEAHVVSAVERAESNFREGQALRNKLKDTLPHYMIPKKVVFHEALPMTPNGKLDRKALAAR